MAIKSMQSTTIVTPIAEHDIDNEMLHQNFQRKKIKGRHCDVKSSFVRIDSKYDFCNVQYIRATPK